MSTVIKIENISKRYRLGLKERRSDTLTGQIGQTIKAPIENFRRLRNMTRFEQEDESIFWALRDINFEVKQGEILGIIGHNGAGKSTLLKVLSRITSPTSGRIFINGRIAALLEVGTGFHQDLTGRENIYLNGTILGMTRREIDLKLDEIVDFSGVEKHLDTPVKFYSSGMKVRLGFSVAAHLEPEILLIDEVLAVGDAAFQKKCLGKMEDISSTKGRTLLFVSHNMAAIQTICERVILLNNGSVIYDGDAISGVNVYSEKLQLKSQNDEKENILSVLSLPSNGHLEVNFDRPFKLDFRIKNIYAKSFSLYFILTDTNGDNIIHHRLDNLSMTRDSKIVRFEFPPMWLRPGVYNYQFKIISTDIASSFDRFISDYYTIYFNGNVDAPNLLGVLTPRVSFFEENK